MEKIGITGNIACGKSVAYEIIKSSGYPVIDCDNIVKNLYLDKHFIEEANEKFPQIIADNKISLKKLSELIFSDVQFKKDFENYIFPKVKEKIIEFHNKNINSKKTFVVVPLLFEAGYENLFDKIIFISSKENIRKTRLIARKSMLSKKAETVIKIQMPEEEKIPKCDYVIKNNGTLDEFKHAVEKIIFYT